MAKVKSVPKAENWYVLFVQPGKEDKVARGLERKALVEGMEDRLRETFAPNERYQQATKAGWVTRFRKKFEGYVFIQAEYTPEVFHLLREFDHVIGVLPRSDRPTPLELKEVEKLLGDAKETKDTGGRTWYEMPYTVGDRVHVTSGPFAKTRGYVRDIDQTEPYSAPVVKVEVEVIGKKIEVSVRYDEIKPC